LLEAAVAARVIHQLITAMQDRDRPRYQGPGLPCCQVAAVRWRVTMPHGA